MDCEVEKRSCQSWNTPALYRWLDESGTSLMPNSADRQVPTCLIRDSRRSTNSVYPQQERRLSLSEGAVIVVSDIVQASLSLVDALETAVHRSVNVCVFLLYVKFWLPKIRVPSLHSGCLTDFADPVQHRTRFSPFVLGAEDRY